MAGIVSVALAAKLVKLFGTGDSGADSQGFMAIPMPGYPMSADDLDFNPDGARAKADPPKAEAARSSFARLVNLIPRGVGLIWDPSPSLVWDEYNRVLTQAEILPREPTRQEKRSLFEARKVLFELKAPDSEEFLVPWTESAKLQAYHAYKLAYETRVAGRMSLKLAAKGLKSQLNGAAKAVDESLRDWETLGYKNEVDAAYETIDQITSNNPRLAWADWKDDFKRSKRTDVAHDASYYDTYMYPDTFVDEARADDWMKLSMDSGEVAELTESARQVAGESLDVVSVAETKSQDVLIKSLSLEAAKIQIIRPWFTPNLIRSRSWKWRSPEMPPLSDGGRPPQGGMVAYATGLIFARNIKIEFADSPVRGAGNALAAGPLKIDPASVSGDRVTSKGIQLIAFICQRTHKSPNPPTSGLILVRNAGAFVATFSVQYVQSGDTRIEKSGEFPVLVTETLQLPADATDILVTVKIATFYKTWSVVGTYQFNKPVTKSFELTGVTWDWKCKEV